MKKHFARQRTSLPDPLLQRRRGGKATMERDWPLL
jgi:hypothetical protein